MPSSFAKEAAHWSASNSSLNSALISRRLLWLGSARIFGGFKHIRTEQAQVHQASWWDASVSPLANSLRFDVANTRRFSRSAERIYH
jgi:hypothetical protein